MHQKEFWRNSRSRPERFTISWLATQNWSNWSRKISPVSCRPTSIWDTERPGYLCQHIWTKCTDETTIRLQRSVNKVAPSSPLVWRRATCTDSFLAVSEMAFVVFFIRNIMVAVEWPLVEIIKFIKVKYLWARELSGTTERRDPSSGFFTKLLKSDTLQNFFEEIVVVRSLTADGNLLQPTGGVNRTLHTSHFLVESHRTDYLLVDVQRHLMEI